MSDIDPIFFGRHGHVFWWDLDAEPRGPEHWACTVSEILLFNDCSGRFTIDKGRSELVQQYVDRTAAGKRPRLRLAFETDDVAVDPLKIMAYVLLDATQTGLQRFLEDPYQIVHEDTEFRWQRLEAWLP